jgi:hypothetical protein
MKWRQGSKVKLNVYEGNRPVCQCHSEEDAARIVAAVGLVDWLQRCAPATLGTWVESFHRDSGNV